ncbi:hypothetical protein D3C83_290210 [compost metagenome]
MPVTDKHADFDQLVAPEAEVDLLEQRRGEPRLANAQVRPQVVGTRSERATNARR